MRAMDTEVNRAIRKQLVRIMDQLDKLDQAQSERLSYLGGLL